jgi:hypothetical protein
MRRPEACVSDLTFDRAAAGELSASAQRELEQHIIDCVSCSVRYDVSSRQRDEFLRQAGDWDAFTQRRVARKRRLKLPARYVTFCATAAVMLIAFTMRWRDAAEQPHYGQLKGSDSIGFYVRRDAHVTRGASGDEVFPADQLRFTYSSGRPQQFALFYADANAASVYYPLGERTTQIAPGRDVPLDFGIALDAQLGAERAFGLFCEQPQRLEPLRAQLQKTGTLQPPAGCHVDILVLQKRLK